MICLKIIITVLIVAFQIQHCYSKSCGTQLLKDQPASELKFKVMGGSEASKGAYPWAVNIQELYKRNLHIVCGGALVNSEWVVTSASCVHRLEGSGVDIYKNVFIALGYHDLRRKETGSLKLHVSKVVVHEGFDLDPIVVNDIALIKLQRPIDLETNPDINTVCLTEKESSWYPDHLCYLAGWGNLNTVTDTKILQEAELPFIKQETCTELYANHSLRQINDDFFCAGTKDKGGCSGDAGSPFVCQKEGIWYLVGIVSGGGGYCHEEEFPTIFVRVESYLDWITKTINQFSCGTQLIKKEPNSEAPQFKVLGGNDAKKGAWPWVVEIQEEYKGKILNRCGGTLINTQWVLTNANCIEIIAGSGTDIFKKLFVAVGFHNLDKNEEGALRVGITKIIVHESFQTLPHVEHDIVLMKLKRPLKGSDSKFINPICLPPDKETNYKDQTCFLAGWGTVNPEADKTPILQEAELSFIDQKTCEDDYASHLTRRITENYFCAGSEGKGYCGGDPGTPFVCQVDDKWYLVGLTSGGGQYCAEEKYPTIFLRIQSYLDWIKETVRLNNCGTRSVEPETEEYRIKGGKDAKTAAWPWAVELQILTNKKFRNKCGGTLISSEWVLTAAHCIVDLDKTVSIYQDMFIAIGYTNLEKAEEGSIKVGISKAIPHPGFKQKVAHDIALLKLKKHVDYTVNKFINTACLPEIGLPYSEYTCFDSGWGRIDSEPVHTPVLQEIQATIMNHDKCLDKFAAKVGRKRSGNYFCGGEGLEGICRGDSGAPFVCEVKDQWHIVGFLSTLKGNCSPPDFPPFFTRVNAYLDWIATYVEF